MPAFVSDSETCRTLRSSLSAPKQKQQLDSAKKDEDIGTIDTVKEMVRKADTELKGKLKAPLRKIVETK